MRLACDEHEPAQAAERERLVEHICEAARLHGADSNWNRYLDFQTRLRKTELRTLRQIVDTDLVNATAREMGIAL